MVTLLPSLAKIAPPLCTAHSAAHAQSRRHAAPQAPPLPSPRASVSHAAHVLRSVVGEAGGGDPKVSSTGCGICDSSSSTDSSSSSSPGASPYSSVSSWRSSSCDLVSSSSEIAAVFSCTLLRLAIAFLSLHRRDQHVVAYCRRVRFVSSSSPAVARSCARYAATHTSLAPRAVHSADVCVAS